MAVTAEMIPYYRYYSDAAGAGGINPESMKTLLAGRTVKKYRR